MAAPAKICAITGVNGFVGSRVAERLRSEGWTIRRFQRSSENSTNCFDDSVRFVLGHPVDSAQLREVDLLVHCAYDYGVSGWQDIFATNVEGTKALLKAAAEANVNRMIYLSSMHAYDGCRSHYGQAKRFSEKWVHQASGVVVRPGTIYDVTDGQLTGGVRGNTLRLLGTLSATAPILPVPYSNTPTIYMTHIADLSALICEIANNTKLPKSPIIAANRQPFTLKELVTKIAKGIYNKQPLVLPVPWRLAWATLKFAESVGLQLSLRSDSIIILFDQDPEPDFTHLNRFQTHFRSFLA